jgi:hypothetical protein
VDLHGGGYSNFSKTATSLVLAEANGARSKPARRSQSRKLVSVAIRSRSEGHTYR